MKIQEILNQKIVNLTPHEIFFHAPGVSSVDKDGNSVPDAIVVPPSGILANARQEEFDSGWRGNAALVKTVFQGEIKTRRMLRDFRNHFPDVCLVGSVISAQAYPGLVVAMIPAKGFERVPPAEKRMRHDKFTVF